MARRRVKVGQVKTVRPRLGGVDGDAWGGSGRPAAGAKGAPPLTTPGSVAAATPPVPAPPVSVSRQAGIDSITARLAGLPGSYNPRRLALYTEGARGLTDDGLFDLARVDVAGQGADGSTTYQVAGRGEGQRMRDAAGQLGSQFGARGAFFSTARENAVIDQRRALDNARQGILRSLSSGQDDLTRQQAEQDASLRGDLSGAQGEYTEWRASQPVPAPPGPAGPNNPRATAGIPSILRNPGASWTPEKLRAAGYKQAGAKHGRNVWVRG